MFKGAIIKLTSFCNLNCSYCYMFNLGDKTFMGVPKFLSAELAEKFITEVYVYMQQNKLREFTVTLHGGEPFLWPIDHFRRLFKKVAACNTKDCTILFAIQTNAYKINWDLVKLLIEYNVPLGVSIDGPEELHNKFRVTHANKPTYDRVMGNISEIFNRGYGGIVGGFLTVPNPSLNPAKYFEWFLNLPVKKISVLWPIEFNYTNKPWEFFNQSSEAYAAEPVYGKWFLDLFKIWWEADRPDLYIRFFYETISIILGGKSHGDTIVNDELSMLVMNTDGSIEYHDYFRALSDKNNATPYSIIRNSLSEIEKDILFQKFFELRNYLPANCDRCLHKNICGGGFLPGRMKHSIEDFSSLKSVLCYDEYYFFNGVKQILSRQRVLTEATNDIVDYASG